MPIYEVTSDRIQKLAETSFARAGLREREDLQRLLREQIDVVAPDVLVLAEEFHEWEDSNRRIDLLGLDKDANLVVIELKRTEDGGHMELQAIRYAAMVADMTFEKAAEVHADHLRRLGREGDAQTAILEFLGWEEPDEDDFAQDVRIVLVSAEFSKEITTAVMWLNERGLDIRCVRLLPYQDSGRVLLDVQQVIPLPEAQEYQVRIKAKAERERNSRREHSELQTILHRFWTELLVEARKKTDLHANISPPTSTWVGASAGHTGCALNYAFGRDAPRVELYIDTGDQSRNKNIFDQLKAARASIESQFGGPLGWERLDAKRACRIRADLSPASVRDEDRWPELQTQMIEAMIRFERAIRPVLEGLEY
jgi:hypothetical protein